MPLNKAMMATLEDVSFVSASHLHHLSMNWRVAPPFVPSQRGVGGKRKFYFSSSPFFQASAQIFFLGSSCSGLFFFFPPSVLPQVEKRGAVSPLGSMVSIVKVSLKHFKGSFIFPTNSHVILITFLDHDCEGD